nr:hypothetical protein [Tanacetum cinerariifolium]
MDLCTRLQRQQTELASKINAQDLEISNLKARIQLLKDKDKGSAELSGDDAPIKGRMELQMSLFPLLLKFQLLVPTVSGMVSTVSAIFTTASVVTPYSRCPREILAKDKGMTLEEIREKFVPVWKQFEDILPMASKEKGERIKRKGLKLEQESAKKIKTSKEVSEEDIKEMMQLVPVEEV